jgi:hypothetical protein
MGLAEPRRVLDHSDHCDSSGDIAPGSGRALIRDQMARIFGLKNRSTRRPATTEIALNAAGNDHTFLGYQ